jgi:hypothetical protein
MRFPTRRPLGLRVDSIQSREERWVIAHLLGKAGNAPIRDFARANSELTNLTNIVAWRSPVPVIWNFSDTRYPRVYE